MGASDKAPPQGVNYDASALPADPHPLTNVLVMGVGFFFVMGGYNPVQSFASSLLNFECIPMGDISIGVVYASLALGSLFAPVVIAKAGPRACMVYGSLAYVTFAASVAYIVLPVVLLASLVIGFLGAFLNIGQGVALAECTTEETRGHYSGILTAFNQGAAVPGNLIAIFLIPASATSQNPRPCGNTTSTLLVPGWSQFDSLLFVGCAGCCLIGTFVLALYRTPPVNAHTPKVPPPTAGVSLRRIWVASTHREGIPLLLPLLFYTGVSNAFWSGMFPRQMEPGLVGPAMCILGGGEVLGGLLVGWMIDAAGVRTALAAVVAVQGGALALAYFADLEQDRVKFWVAAGLLGVADNGVTTMSYALLSNRGSSADSGKIGSVEGLESAAETTPLLGGEKGVAEVVGGGTVSLEDGTEEGYTFDSTDGFSVFFFLNSVAVAVLFFLLPVFAGASGRSSSMQFLLEEAVTFGLLLLAAAAIFVDEWRIQARRQREHAPPLTPFSVNK